MTKIERAKEAIREEVRKMTTTGHDRYRVYEISVSDGGESDFSAGWYILTGIDQDEPDKVFGYGEYTGENLALGGLLGVIEDQLRCFTDTEDLEDCMSIGEVTDIEELMEICYFVSRDI